MLIELRLFLFRASFWIDKNNNVHIGVLKNSKEVVAGIADWNNRNPNKTGELLKNKQIVMTKGGRCHPRTAIGYDSSKRWLTFVVVDGRRKGHSKGVMLYELAKIMKQRGCSRAINLDGGGSTIMIAKDGNSTKTINRPSGNAHRPIPVMIGIKLK